MPKDDKESFNNFISNIALMIEKSESGSTFETDKKNNEREIHLEQQIKNWQKYLNNEKVSCKNAELSILCYILDQDKNICDDSSIFIKASGYLKSNCITISINIGDFKEDCLPNISRKYTLNKSINNPINYITETLDTVIDKISKKKLFYPVSFDKVKQDNTVLSAHESELENVATQGHTGSQGDGGSEGLTVVQDKAQADHQSDTGSQVPGAETVQIDIQSQTGLDNTKGDGGSEGLTVVQDQALEEHQSDTGSQGDGGSEGDVEITEINNSLSNNDYKGNEEHVIDAGDDKNSDSNISKYKEIFKKKKKIILINKLIKIDNEKMEPYYFNGWQ